MMIISSINQKWFMWFRQNKLKTNTGSVEANSTAVVSQLCEMYILMNKSFFFVLLHFQHSCWKSSHDFSWIYFYFLIWHFLRSEPVVLWAGYKDEGKLEQPHCSSTDHSGSDALWLSVRTRGGADLCYLAAQGETHLNIIREAVLCEYWSCPSGTTVVAQIAYRRFERRRKLWDFFNAVNVGALETDSDTEIKTEDNRSSFFSRYKLAYCKKHTDVNNNGMITLLYSCIPVSPPVSLTLNFSRCKADYLIFSSQTWMFLLSPLKSYLSTAV